MVNADFASTALWAGLIDRPDTFPPSAHTTDVSTITDSGAQEGYIAAWVDGHMKFVPPGSVPGVGSGSVTRFWFTNANGVAGDVTDPETQPRLKLKLNDITPLSVTSPGNITSGGILTGVTIVSVGDITDGGDLIFMKVGARIKADLTNATRANRLLFQTSTANTNSLVGVVPSGSGTTAGWNASNSSDPDNAGVLQFVSSSTLARINSTHTGTGTTNPIGFQIDDVTKLSLQTNGDLVSTDNASYTSWQGGLTGRGYYVQHESADSGFFAARAGAGIGFGATSFTGTVAGGTWTSKSATPLGGGVVLRLEGWDTTGWFQSNGYLAITAQETWSATGHGTRAALYQTRIGDTVGKEVLVFDATTTLAPNIRTTSPAAATASITVAVPNDTGLAATYESFGVQFQSATRAWLDGTVAVQREFAFGAPTYNKTTTAATFTKAATVAISGAPNAGTGVTLTNAYALWVQAGKTQLDGLLSVGDTTDASSTSVASLVAAGGLGVAKAAYFGGVVHLSDTTDSSSYTTGSLQVAGGVGISKSLYARALQIGDGTSLLNRINVNGKSTQDVITFDSLAANQTVIGDNGSGGVGTYGVASGDAYIGTITGGGFATIAGGALAFTAYNTAGGTRVDFVNPMRIANVPSYANNAAAVTGGLSVGDLYRNGDSLCIVH